MKPRITGTVAIHALALHRDGCLDGEIAGILGVSRSGIQWWRTKVGLPRNSWKGRIHRMWHYRAILLAHDGYAAWEIARLLGRNRKAIISMLLRKGISCAHKPWSRRKGGGEAMPSSRPARPPMLNLRIEDTDEEDVA